jgi:hypothetical protein
MESALNAGATIADEASRPIHCIGLISAVKSPTEVLSAIQDYLNAWPVDRVARLQSMDCGLAPFDHNQRPSPIHDVHELGRIGDAIQHRCVALRQSQIAPAAELIELSEIFYIATRMAEALNSPEFKARLLAGGPPATMLNLL